MALNTRERRASAGACGIISLVTPELPDGTIGAGDRLQLLGMYAGVIAGAAEPPLPAASPQQPVGRLLDIAEPVGSLSPIAPPVGRLV